MHPNRVFSTPQNLPYRRRIREMGKSHKVLEKRVSASLFMVLGTNRDVRDMVGT